MKIGLVQYSPEWENSTGSISKIEGLLEEMQDKVDALIFPELTLTGFSMNIKQIAEDIDGIGIKFFMNLSERINTNVFAGFAERTENGVYNSLIHFNPQGLIAARYRKIHPFSYGQEDKFYNSSKEIVITGINKTKIGLSICYDLRFPELYRLYAKERVGLIINIANWPIPRIEHWKSLLKARAIENQCFVIGVNRTGADPFHTYNGCSSVFDPTGKEILIADEKEKIYLVEFDLSLVDEVRNKLPFLNDIKLI